MTKEKNIKSFNRNEVPRKEYSDTLVMDKNPFVSVMMITYNHEKYIGQAIKGVINQKTNFPIELIIGEDCSTDRTREVIFNYQKKHPDIIRLITSDENVGARKNSSRCDWSCRGKYVAYCEGDDYWHNMDKLQKQVDYLEGYPDYGMVYSNADTFNVETGERVKFAMSNYPEKFSNDPYLDLLLGSRQIWPLTVCVRRDLMNKILIECPECTDLSYLMGDTQRFLEISRRSKIKYFSESLSTRNYLPESATRSQDVNKKIRFIESSKKLMLHYLEKYPLDSETDRIVKKWVFLRSLYYSYLSYNRKIAKENWQGLRSLSIKIPLKYWLYYIGSKNSFGKFFTQSVYWAITVCGNLKQIVYSFSLINGTKSYKK